jgi:hypothetical protein
MTTYHIELVFIAGLVLLAVVIIVNSIIDEYRLYRLRKAKKESARHKP